MLYVIYILLKNPDNTLTHKGDTHTLLSGNKGKNTAKPPQNPKQEKKKNPESKREKRDGGNPIDNLAVVSFVYLVYTAL